MRSKVFVAIAAASPALLTASTFAGAHTWRVSELFSNASGTIQFVEIQECCGLPGEVFLNGYDVESVATGNSFSFPANLVGSSANKHILLGTVAFAALPGAPPVDHLIPVNFFSVNGDTIQYGLNPPAQTNDSFTFGAGVLPTNGKHSIQITNFVTHTFVTQLNAPQNYNNGSGHVDACPSDCDGSNDGEVDITDFLAVLAQWGATGSCNGASPVGINEFLNVLGVWGTCP